MLNPRPREMARGIVLALDGGGSKTDGMELNLDGKILARSTMPGPVAHVAVLNNAALALTGSAEFA